MGTETYVPILKGKAGEFRALLELLPDVRGRITPLVDIPRVPLTERTKSLDSHLDKVIQGIAKSWDTEHPVFVDLFDLDLNARVTNGEHPVHYTLTQLHSRGVQAVPVVGLERDVAYEHAVRDVVPNVESVVVRLLVEDLEATGSLAPNVVRILKSVKVDVAQTHLIFDLRSLRDSDISQHVAIVLRALRALPMARECASLVVTGSTVPQSLADDVPANSLRRIPRRELDLWRRLRSMPGITRRLSFGDYGVVHPDNLDLDPRKITLVASIRYTTNDALVVVRGKSFKSHPAGYGQYYDLSKVVVALPDFRGSAFSWGDRQLAARAARTCGPGNKTTWVAIDTSHHLAYVDDQLQRAA